MTDIPDNFANHPKSISEIRAERTEGGAGIWTVRDCLIAALRAIDSGEIVPVSAVLVITTNDERGDTHMEYYQCVKSTLERLGILTRATYDGDR